MYCHFTVRVLCPFPPDMEGRIWVPVQACIVETVINGPWTISNLQACFQPYVYERVVALQVNEHLYDDEVIEKFQSA